MALQLNIQCTGLSLPAERWEAHVRRQDFLPEIEDVRMQMTDHACVSRHSRGKCYGCRGHQSTRQSQRFCCVNGTPVLKDRPRRQMAFSRPLGPCWEALGRLLESLGRLLGSLGRHFGEPWGPLEASWVVPRRFLGARCRSARISEDFGRNSGPVLGLKNRHFQVKNRQN